MIFNHFNSKAGRVLLVVACLVGWSVCNLGSADTDFQFRAKRTLALSNEDWHVRRRAVQEIAASDEKNEAVAQAMLALADREMLDGEIYDLVFALRDTVSAKQVERLLGDVGSERSSIIVCLAVGIMGERGKAYVRTLQRTVSNQTVPKTVRLAARIGLANLGVFGKQDITEISSALHDAKGLRSTALFAMMFRGKDEWMTEEVLRDLCAILDEDSPYHSGSAAVILSRLAGRSKHARDALAKAVERARTNRRLGDGIRLLYEFSSARPESGWSSNRLREPVRLLGKSSLGFDLPVQAGILMIAHFLVETNDVKSVTCLLRDSEQEVVLGAVKLCWGIGVVARDAENDLLAVLEKWRDEEVRGIAALALGAVGGDRSLTELERLADKEPSPEVRNAIETSVNLIKRCSAKW
jgi:HEAT repeat protein